MFNPGYGSAQPQWAMSPQGVPFPVEGQPQFTNPFDGNTASGSQHMQVQDDGYNYLAPANVEPSGPSSFQTLQVPFAGIVQGGQPRPVQESLEPIDDMYFNPHSFDNSYSNSNLLQVPHQGMNPRMQPLGNPYAQSQHMGMNAGVSRNADFNQQGQSTLAFPQSSSSGYIHSAASTPGYRPHAPLDGNPVTNYPTHIRHLSMPPGQPPNFNPQARRASYGGHPAASSPLSASSLSPGGQYSPLLSSCPTTPNSGYAYSPGYASSPGFDYSPVRSSSELPNGDRFSPVIAPQVQLKSKPKPASQTDPKFDPRPEEQRPKRGRPRKVDGAPAANKKAKTGQTSGAQDKSVARAPAKKTNKKTGKDLKKLDTLGHELLMATALADTPSVLLFPAPGSEWQKEQQERQEDQGAGVGVPVVETLGSGGGLPMGESTVSRPVPEICDDAADILAKALGMMPGGPEAVLEACGGMKPAQNQHNPVQFEKLWDMYVVDQQNSWGNIDVDATTGAGVQVPTVEPYGGGARGSTVGPGDVATVSSASVGNDALLEQHPGTEHEAPRGSINGQGNQQSLPVANPSAATQAASHEPEVQTQATSGQASLGENTLGLEADSERVAAFTTDSVLNQEQFARHSWATANFLWSRQHCRGPPVTFAANGRHELMAEVWALLAFMGRSEETWSRFMTMARDLRGQILASNPRT